MAHAAHRRGCRAIDVPVLVVIADAEAAEAAAVPIGIAEPDPAWAERFDGERSVLRRALGQAAVGIEHIGSTAVRDLPAKPVVDVLVGVPSSADIVDACERATALGYSWWRDAPTRTSTGSCCAARTAGVCSTCTS